MKVKRASSAEPPRAKPLLFLQHHANFLSIIAYPCGIVVFSLLASSLLNDKTYFSDNSLLPGLVERTTNIASNAETLLEDLEVESSKHAGLPYAWLMGQFRQIGLEVYKHNFTLRYPLGTKGVHRGDNVYAILRAPRAARTEAIVISAPYRIATHPHGTTLPSIVTMIALAQHYRKQQYWSKDIIFVIMEHELVGLQSWLDAYHLISSSPDVLDVGHLEARSGNIMAAINLELHDKYIDQVNVKILGLNGQLPNLDMVNTCTDLLLREHVPHVLEGNRDVYETKTYRGWKKAAKNLFKFMQKHATGSASGAHGLYHRFAIQALTLQGQAKRRGYQHVTLNHIGRVVEGLTRSVNNLLQRFHRSFFYYYLPTTNRYVSIAYYMSAFGIMASPIAFKAVSLLLQLSQSTEQNYLNLIWRALPLPFIVQILGVLVFSLPCYSENIIKKLFNLPAADCVYIYITFCSAIMLILPFITKYTNHITSQRLIMLIHYAVAFVPLAILNISLATLGVAITLPIVYTSGVEGRNIILHFIHRLLQLLIHPFSLSFIVLLLHSLNEDRWNFGNLESNLAQAFQGHRKLFLFGIEDWYLYGNVHFPLFSLVFLPVWVHMWAL